MKITITDEASHWFQEEFEFGPTQGIRFFGKVYGSSPVHEGFSIGLEVSEIVPLPWVKVEKDGITYFVDQNDDWFFSGFDLVVDYDAKKDEPVYLYQEVLTEK